MYAKTFSIVILFMFNASSQARYHKLYIYSKLHKKVSIAMHAIVNNLFLNDI